MSLHAVILALMPTALVAAEEPSAAAILTEPAPARCGCEWRADLLVGVPTGLRVQKQLGESRVWLEGGAGAYLILPTVFAGIRTEGRIVETKHHMLSVRPGLDVYYMQGYDYQSDYARYRLYDTGHVPTYVTPALDFDFEWRLRWAEQFHSTCGLKLGCGVAISHDRSFVVPIAALTVGFNY